MAVTSGVIIRERNMGGPEHTNREGPTPRGQHESRAEHHKRPQTTAASNPSHTPSPTPASLSLAGAEGVIHDVKLEALTSVIAGVGMERITCVVTAGVAVGVRTREDAAGHRDTGTSPVHGGYIHAAVVVSLKPDGEVNGASAHSAGGTRAATKAAREVM